MQEQNNSRPSLKRQNIREALKIYAFIRPYQAHFIFGLFLLFISSAVFMVFPWSIGKMLDVAGKQVQGPSYSLVEMGLFWIIILVFQGFVSYARVRMFAVVSEKGTADIRAALYKKVISLPIVFFEKNRVGDLISRLTNDVEKLYSIFYFVLAEFVRQFLLLIGGVVYLAWQTPKLAGVMLAVIPIIVIGAMIFGRQIRKLSKERQQTLGESNTMLDETLQTIQAVKAFTNEAFEIGRYHRTNAHVVDVSMRFAHGRGLFATFIITVLFGALFFVIFMGLQMVQNNGMSIGQLVSFVTFTAVIGASIAGLGSFYTELVGAVGATERILEILDQPTESEERKTTGLEAGRLSGAIEFDQVRFSYPTRSDIEVLKKVSFRIEPGTKVALVGQSGAGKSTIMQLLLQFHQASSGEIRIDGKNIREYDLKSFRQNFALVPQEVILFGGSIRENIIYGKPDASDEEIIEAARKANAWDFISSFPEGLDTIVGERGIKLSGGQRQRIAIARAILRDPSILLLDEATSSLDAESEKLVQDALNYLMEGRTSIIIAHRLATIRDVDQIYVLDHGAIIEQGTHLELSQMEEGVYSSLARLQFEV